MYMLTHQMVFRLTGALIVGVVAILIAGCSSEGMEHPPTYSVTGKVTYKGETVPKGGISFHGGEGRPASGKIQPDGTYSLSTFSEGDGAVAGHYTVSIVANEADTTKMPRPGEKPPKDLVPKKYSRPETSGLTADVEKKANEVNFDLK
jgi:hypothetical protein